MLPLNMAPKGEELKVKEVSGRPDVKKHLADLGFVSGASVTVITELRGNLIVNIKESRIAIGREMALKIKV